MLQFNNNSKLLDYKSTEIPTKVSHVAGAGMQNIFLLKSQSCCPHPENCVRGFPRRVRRGGGCETIVVRFILNFIFTSLRVLFRRQLIFSNPILLAPHQKLRVKCGAKIRDSEGTKKANIDCATLTLHDLVFLDNYIL